MIQEDSKLQMNSEISCHDGYDDDVSLLSFGENKSYICDLYSQKKNRKKDLQEESLEEAHKLYSHSLKKGAPKTEELFLVIFQQVEKEKKKEYRESEKLLDERLEEALQAELDRQDAKEKDLTEDNGKESKEKEIKILEKKLAKVKLMIKAIRDDKEAQKDRKKTKQLKKLKQKYEDYKTRLAERSETVTMDSTMTASVATILDAFNRVTDASDDEESVGMENQRIKETNREKKISKQIHAKKTKDKKDSIESSSSMEQKEETKESQDLQLTSLQLLEARRSALLAEAQMLRQKLQPSQKSKQEPKPVLPLISIKNTVTTDRTSIKQKKKKIEPRQIQKEQSSDSVKTVDQITSETKTGEPEEEKLYYTLNDFKSGKVDGSVDMTCWENHLRADEFREHFKMTKEEFAKHPKWKQAKMRRKLRTWN